MADLRSCKASELPRFGLAGTSTECKLLDACDGDTVDLAMVVFGRACIVRCRLAGINAPEMKGETRAAGLRARNRLLQLATDQPISIEEPAVRDRLRQLLEPNRRVLFARLGRSDKYGRWLVELLPEQGAAASVNRTLVQEGHAQLYDGGQE